MIIETSGILSYSMSQEGYKLVVEVDPEISRLARSLIPKHFASQPTRYPAHITVVRKEVPTVLEQWKKRQGFLAQFEYSTELAHNETYFWLRCWSPALTDIRLELGLPESTEYTRPPSGEVCFHITVANTKKVSQS